VFRLKGVRTAAARAPTPQARQDSGNAGLPMARLVGDVFEQGLERWVLPRLSGAAAVNAAHDLGSENQRLSGSSLDRLSKALVQIKRGKPRKEIAKPPYAAEMLWAFRRDTGSRKAVGAEQLGMGYSDRG